MKPLSYLGEFKSQFDVRYLTGIFTLKNDQQFWIVSYRDIYGPFSSLEEAENAGQEFEIYKPIKELKDPFNLIKQELNENYFKELISPENNIESSPSVLSSTAAYLAIPPNGYFPPKWATDLAIKTNNNRIKQLTITAALIIKEIERLQNE